MNIPGAHVDAGELDVAPCGSLVDAEFRGDLVRGAEFKVEPCGLFDEVRVANLVSH